MPIIIEISDELVKLPEIKQIQLSDAEIFHNLGLDNHDGDFLETIPDDRALADFAEVEKRDFISRLIEQSGLTKMELKILQMWLEGDTLTNIAKSVGKRHYSQVQTILKQVILKLRVAATQFGERVDNNTPIVSKRVRRKNAISQRPTR